MHFRQHISHQHINDMKPWHRVLDNPRSRHDASFAFPRQCVFIKLCGTWPVAPDPRSAASRALATAYRCWGVAVVANMGWHVFVQAWYVVEAWGNVLEVTECGCTVLMGFHNLVRLMHLVAKRRRLGALNRRFVAAIWTSSHQNPAVAAECARHNRIYSLVSALMFLLICMYVLVPLPDYFADPQAPVKPLPYKMIYPYNPYEPVSVYAVIYVLASLAGFAVVGTLLAEDSLFGFYVSHLCGQFRQLHERIEQLKRSIAAYAMKRGTHAEVKRCFNGIVRQHNILISFAEELQSFFSPILLVNFTISSMLICLTGFQIAAVKMNALNAVKLFVYVVSALAQLFILCWTGDKLIELSSATGNRMYECDWQRLISGPPTVQLDGGGVCRRRDMGLLKNILFVIRRSQKPVRVTTAMEFSVLSLTSFAGILSTSGSYFTLLQSLVETNE